jgi:hypothetical protein
VASGGHPLGDYRSESFEPRLSIFVRERPITIELVEIARRMEVISIGKTPAELVRQTSSDRRLAGAGGSHEDDDEHRPVHRIGSPMGGL